MDKARKMCFDRILPTELNQVQRTRSMANGRDRAISLIGKQWVNGSTITIRFLEGTEAQKSMVREVAPRWTDYANLAFEFTDDPTAVIRIGFNANDGAWSYVGTDNLNIPLHAATMNLGWQDEAVILHEFGHMIGLSHEHQNPDGGMQWNEEVVIAELAGPPNFWTEQQTRHNVLNKYSADQVHGTEFDPQSIMLYAFPASWTLDGRSTEENEKLSDMDKAFIRAAAMYPPEDDTVQFVELGVAAALKAEIGAPGEIDTYRFTVDDAGEYIMQTLGDTDVVMALYGPGDPTRKLDENDDSGAGRNAQIVANLAPGEYFLQVRHFSEQRAGAYRIVVTR